jgi:hypothetical protein
MGSSAGRWTALPCWACVMLPWAMHPLVSTLGSQPPPLASEPWIWLPLDEEHDWVWLQGLGLRWHTGWCHLKLNNRETKRESRLDERIPRPIKSIFEFNCEVLLGTQGRVSSS